MKPFLSFFTHWVPTYVIISTFQCWSLQSHQTDNFLWDDNQNASHSNCLFLSIRCSINDPRMPAVAAACLTCDWYLSKFCLKGFLKAEIVLFRLGSERSIWWGENGQMRKHFWTTTRFKIIISLPWKHDTKWKIIYIVINI